MYSLEPAQSSFRVLCINNRLYVSCPYLAPIRFHPMKAIKHSLGYRTSRLRPFFFADAQPTLCQSQIKHTVKWCVMAGKIYLILVICITWQDFKYRLLSSESFQKSGNLFNGISGVFKIKISGSHIVLSVCDKDIIGH